jgi:hypothetical protein
VAAALRPEAARELLPGFLNAALEGFALDDPLLKDYGYGLLAKGCEVLEQDFVPWLERSVQLAFESLDMVCLLGHRTSQIAPFCSHPLSDHASKT